ncbi:MAG: phosphonate ABC transporter ATP-binding protein [Planctomycetia bacterium]
MAPASPGAGTPGAAQAAAGAAAADAQPLLQVRGLRKAFPNGYQALKGIDLDVQRGEFVCILGLSGAGKSTFLRCLNGLIEPSEGSIRLGGQEVSGLKGRELRRLRGRVAMIFQKFNLVPRATALTNVLTGALLRTPTPRALLGLWDAADRAEALEHLALVGLSEHAHHRVEALSGGQQQRVAIARALLQHPEVMLADEPVASLDPATSHTVMGHLKRLQQEKGITILANLHFLSLAREYGTRVVALKGGQKVFEGPPASITDAVFKGIYGEDAMHVEIR